MTQQQAPQEINNLTAGLITDANPLNPVPNSCKDIENIVINRNGLNSRRLGINYEDDYIDIETSVPYSDDVIVNTYTWENAGGNNDVTFLVVQVGNEFKIINLDNSPISGGVIHTVTFPLLDVNTRISFSNIDSFLIAVNGDGNIYSYEYNPTDETFISQTNKILVRDLWGLEDIDTNGDDLRDGSNIQKRPTTLSQTHLYNLRNQSFGIERPQIGNATPDDPITRFFNLSDTFNPNGVNYYPSNADSVNYAFYPNPLATSDPQVKRFWERDLIRSQVGTFEAARGYFIIDLLNRGQSRLDEISANNLRNTTLNLDVTTLPEDRTDGGATVTAEFAGRAFYAGFNGETIDGDSKSPRLASYVLFSQLIRDIGDINKCYQEADPTSDLDTTIVATDGGFIRIDGAYNIQQMIATGNKLIVLAENGIWSIIGGNDLSFSADNFRVDKLSEQGCVSSNSVVYVDGLIYYWSDNGIYAIGNDSIGSSQVQNITRDKIQFRYNRIDENSKKFASGKFDSYDRKVKWLYNNRIGNVDYTQELILDVDLNSFYTNNFKTINNNLPKIVDVALSNEYQQIDNTLNDTLIDDRENTIRELIYIVATGISPTITYTIGLYNDLKFKDWVSFDNQGVDAEGFILVNDFTTGDSQRRKKLNSLMVHMARTEVGVEADDNGVLNPMNRSSCIVQTRWDWTNSNNSNRWSVPRQYYRPKRYYAPTDENDQYDTGFTIVNTKDIVRGHGKSVNILFSTEAERDFQLHGWAMIWAVGDNEGD